MIPLLCPTLNDLKTQISRQPGKSLPTAIVFAEDRVEVTATLRHLTDIGFKRLILIDRARCEPDDPELEDILHVSVAFARKADVMAILNNLIPHLAGNWIYFGYNAEFPYFAFQDSRSISDVIAFMEDERRQSVQCHVVDLYAQDLLTSPEGVNLKSAYFDRSGYYSEQRYDGPVPLEDQYNLFGGLKWRFGEHVPWADWRIDRVSMFKAVPGVTLGPDFLFNTADMNTLSCPWHHNLTMAVASFRTAKALLRNPRSAEAIDTLMAPQSEPFAWSAQQLMTHGFMEPGQWF